MEDRLIRILDKSFMEQYEKRGLLTAQHTASDLLANGVIVPPCKVGDKIYQTDGVQIYESTIYEVTYTTNKVICCTENICFDETAIGKSIFLTKEEAEEKLKEREGN